MPPHRILKRRMLGRDVYTLALERAAHALELYDETAVSFSGGKDSTATLHIVLEAARVLDKLPLRVVFFDEEAIPYETEDYVRRVAAMPEVRLEWYCLPVKHRNGCSRTSPTWWPWAPEDRSKWVRPLPPEAITTLEGFDHETPERRLSIPDLAGLLAPPHGSFGFFLGIRAAESITRHRAVSMKREENYISNLYGATGLRSHWKIYPVYDWRTEDVWTAPARFGWDYNRAYDAMEMAGVPHHQQRCAPPYGEEPMQNLWTFAVCFPDVWDRMQDRVPGAAAAARYSRSELYSFGKRAAKPTGLTWQEWIKHNLGKHEPKMRKHAAYRVRMFITWHYEKTSEPIVDEAAHPESGVSWEFLNMIATRGDLKKRKQPVVTPPERVEVRASERRRYIERARAMLEAGELRPDEAARIPEIRERSDDAATA